MKNFVKPFLVLCLTLITFTSCQEEIDIVEEGNAEENLTANSTLVTLMQRTSSDVGYTDDVLDNFRCGRVELPVTVELNGITVIIDSESDLELIINIFDEFDDDDDIVHFVFPIKVTLRNHTEIVIENQSQLDSLISECQEDEDEDEIECIDFVYPITMLTYNSNNEQLGSFSVANDAEMYLFLSGLEAGISASIQFPIKVKLADGSMKEINSNTQLQEAISQAKLLCDDDDNSVDAEPFVRILIDGSWYIHSLVTENLERACLIAGFEFKFNENHQVRIAKDNMVVEGTWRVGAHDGHLGLKIDLETDNELFAFLDDEWFVFRYDAERFKLVDRKHDFTGYVIFERTPLECYSEEDVLAIGTYLTTQAWLVASYTDDGVDETQNYSNFVLTFSSNGTVVTTNGVDVINGTWNIDLSVNNALKFNVNFGETVPFAELNDSWDIASFTETRLEVKDFDDDDDDIEGYDRLVIERF